MANIATSARTSLQDVRQVLTATAGGTPRAGAAPPASTASSRVSAPAATRSRSTEVGTPQPLPPELEVVAFRVLQEMLTNAIKHGRRDRPVLVERHWEGELRIEVRNVIDASAAETQPLVDGRAGPRARRPGARRDAAPARVGRRPPRRTPPRRGRRPTFTATAWVPVRAR